MMKFLFVLVLLITGCSQKRTTPTPPNYWPSQSTPIPDNPRPKPPEPKIEPIFVVWDKLRVVNDPALGSILSDIDSHMPAGHTFKFPNPMTWAHETTHGINANIRNKYFQINSQYVNGFYCLNDRGCVIVEPKTFINRIAPRIPSQLRGPSYQLYLLQSTGWNDRPLYLFDEWTAYTNGSLVGRELGKSGWYYELLQAHNFNVYCIYVAMITEKECPGYDHTQMKAFMMWNIERTFDLLRSAGDDSNPTAEALQYVEKVRTLPEAAELRDFCRLYFGSAWCQRVYGF